jgi:hypothetical protein
MRFKKRVHETRIGASPLNNLHLLMHLLLKVLVERQYLSAPRFCVYIMLKQPQPWHKQHNLLQVLLGSYLASKLTSYLYLNKIHVGIKTDYWIDSKLPNYEDILISPLITTGLSR